VRGVRATLEIKHGYPKVLCGAKVGCKAPAPPARDHGRLVGHKARLWDD